MRLPLSALAALLFIAATACAADPEPLPDTLLLIHKDGSTTLTVDGAEHVLRPGQINRQATTLLSGKAALLLIMEDWSAIERTFETLGKTLHAAGVHSVTLKLNFEGKEEIRTFELQPPSLEEELAGRDPEVRKAALDKLEEMLKSDNLPDRSQALEVLQKSHAVRFDRQRFLPLVRPLLSSDANLVYNALQTIASLGGDKTDVPAIVAHVDHENPTIHGCVSAALFAVNPEGDHPAVGPAIEKLLDDRNNAARIATIKSLWGCPSTPEVDAKLIDISRGPEEGGSSDADIAIYYALSTRPLVRKPVAERLIELAKPDTLYGSRAAWGLSHHTPDEEARPIVTEALVKILDTFVDRDTRENVLFGLANHGGEKGLERVEQVALDPNESQHIRDYARQLLPQERQDALASKTPAAYAETAPFEPPAELWQRIEQTRDLKLREKALSDVETLLHGDEEETIKGLNVLLKVYEASFDRERFVFLVERLRFSSNKTAQALALAVMSTLGPKSIDAKTLASYVDDENDLIRQVVAETIFRVDPEAKDESTPKTVETLLADRNPEVVHSMIRAGWGKPSSPAAEELIIDLTYHGALGYDAVYYALSTRPLIRKPAAERLIDLAYTSKEHRGRAIWGLSSNAVDADAQSLVTDALIEIIDSTADNYDRWQAIVGLGRLQIPAAKSKLQQMLDDPSETDDVKKHVREQLPQQ